MKWAIAHLPPPGCATENNGRSYQRSENGFIKFDLVPIFIPVILVMFVHSYLLSSTQLYIHLSFVSLVYKPVSYTEWTHSGDVEQSINIMAEVTVSSLIQFVVTDLSIFTLLLNDCFLMLRSRDHSNTKHEFRYGQVEKRKRRRKKVENSRRATEMLCFASH